MERNETETRRQEEEIAVNGEPEVDPHEEWLDSLYDQYCDWHRHYDPTATPE